MTREEIELYAYDLGDSDFNHIENCIYDSAFSVIKVDEDIEKFYKKAITCLVYYTDNDISFGEKTYYLYPYNSEYYEKPTVDENGLTIIDELSYIPREEIKERLESFMRGYKLKKIMKKI
jgi:hypothetical protein